MRTILATRRAYIAIVAAIAVATAGGMIALWPQGETPPLKFIEGTPLGDTHTADVVSVTTYECALYATALCQRVTLELNEGPEEGRSVKTEVNTGGGLPEFSVGDEV
jgi:hypothetical protein